MKVRQPKAIIYLSSVTALFLTIVSFSGAFLPGTYQLETVSMAVQGMGQDIFDLFIIVPLLLISMLFAVRGNIKALLAAAGTTFYIMYSFFIYSFGIHFNYLFLFYCFTLGSSFYLFIIYVSELLQPGTENWFESNVPTKSTAIFFSVIAVMFIFLWFSDILPAVFNGSVPASVKNYNLLVNPVHVLDISFVLPGLITLAVMLIKRKKIAFLLSPVLIIFIFLLSLALIAMAVMLIIKNVSEDLSLAGIFSVLAIISLLYLIRYFRSIKIQSA